MATNAKATGSVSPASPPSGRSIGTIYGNVDALRDDATELFSQYEGDLAVADLINLANEIGSRAYRIAAALSHVEEGLNQL